MKTVMAFGSFDILHEGHKAYLREAKTYGDQLIVVVARDANIKKFKGKAPKHDELYRLDEIKKLDFVNLAVLGKESDIFSIFDGFRPDIICLGYDQSTASEEKINVELKKRNLKARIVRAKPYAPERFKSSLLR